MTTEPSIFLKHGGRQRLDFIRIHKDEPSTTAYVGFGDVQQLRRFVVSQEFLQFFDRYDLEWSMGLRFENAVALIRDEFIDGDATDEYPLSIDKIDRHAQTETRDYESKQRTQNDRRLAHLLVLMVHTFGAGDQLVSDIGSQKDFSVNLMATRRHVKHIPSVADDIEVTRPTLVFPALEETRLEPYSRAFTLLKYFAYSINSKTHWPTRFEKDSWDTSIRVDDYHVPSWMKDAKTSTSAQVLQNPLAEAHAQLPVRHIQLRWVRGIRGANEEERELDEYLNELETSQGLQPLATMMDCLGDPRTLEPDEFRDIIRLQYNCDELKMQLSRIAMVVKEDQSDKEDRAPTEVFDLFDTSETMWQCIRSAVESTSQPIAIILRFVKLADDERCMESFQPPAQLREIFLKVRPTDDSLHKKTDQVIENSVSFDQFIKEGAGQKSRPGAYVSEVRKHYPNDADTTNYVAHFACDIPYRQR